MAYQRIETVHIIAHKRTVPTVRELLQAIRRHAYPTAVAYSDGARCLEAGTRLAGHSGELTVDASLWLEDSDLFDFENIADVLQSCRTTDPDTWPEELDVYVRDSEELLGNVDLRPDPNGWQIITTAFRHIEV